MKLDKTVWRLSWNNNKRGPHSSNESKLQIDIGAGQVLPGSFKATQPMRDAFICQNIIVRRPSCSRTSDKQAHFRWSNILTSARCNAPERSNKLHPPSLNVGERTFSTRMKIYDCCCVSLVKRRLFFTMEWYTRNENGTKFLTSFHYILYYFINNFSMKLDVNIKTWIGIWMSFNFLNHLYVNILYIYWKKR